MILNQITGGLFYMTTLFEQQGVQYEIQGDYKLPCRYRNLSRKTV